MEDKILELKKQLDLLLEDYAVDKVEKDSGGKRRSSKANLTENIFHRHIEKLFLDKD